MPDFGGIVPHRARPRDLWTPMMRAWMGYRWKIQRVSLLCAVHLQAWTAKNAPCRPDLYTPIRSGATIPADVLPCWWVWCTRISRFATCIPGKIVWAWPWFFPGLPLSESCSMCGVPAHNGHEQADTSHGVAAPCGAVAGCDRIPSAGALHAPATCHNIAS